MIVVPAVRRFLTAIESAESIATRDLNQGLIATEPSLTERFLGALEMALEQGIESDGYYLNVRTLRDRGRNAPEREFGADLVSIFRVDIAEFHISKGFLAQAKIAGKGGVTVKHLGREVPHVLISRTSHDSADPTSLYSQCRQMLAVSPDSYVFIYDQLGMYSVAASSVVSLANDGRAHRVHMKLLRWFMNDFFGSFVGDIRINAHDDASLRLARDINLSNYAAMFEIRESKRPNEL